VSSTKVLFANSFNRGEPIKVRQGKIRGEVWGKTIALLSSKQGKKKKGRNQQPFRGLEGLVKSSNGTNRDSTKKKGQTVQVLKRESDKVPNHMRLIGQYVGSSGGRVHLEETTEKRKTISYSNPPGALPIHIGIRRWGGVFGGSYIRSSTETLAKVINKGVRLWKLKKGTL